jgi:Tfp pilus assembly protein PilZ
MIDAPPRIPCEEPCFIAGEAVVQATTRNVSTKGVFVVLDPLPELGAHLLISFSLPDEPEPIGTLVRVVWQNPPSGVAGRGSRAPQMPPGCGLEFVDIDEPDLERIRAHVTARVAAKELIH